MQFLLINVHPSTAATLTGSTRLGSALPDQTGTTYTHTISNISLSLIKCIKVSYSTSLTSQTKPTGMDITSASLSSSTTYIPTPANWTISNNNTTGVITLTNATGETPAAASTRYLIFLNITNGSITDTAYYASISTFNNVDCTTNPVDTGVSAFLFTDGQYLEVTVEPSFTFIIAALVSGTDVNGTSTNITTTDGTVPLGKVTTSTNKVGAHRLSITTNAINGYTVTTRYTGVLLHTNGVDDINNHTGTNASPTAFPAAGTEAFGYTTEDFTLGTGTANRFSTNKWAAFTTSPVEIMYGSAAGTETVDFGYQVGIAAATSAGFYQTTVIYTATPIY